MIIMGIDPGSHKTGISFIEKQSRTFKIIKAEVIKLDSNNQISRPGEIFDKIYEYFELYSPHHFALESLIFHKGPQTLIKLAQVRGAILAAIKKFGSEKIFEYSPNLIKSTISGHGHADKKSIEKTLDFILGKYNYPTDDASDATAVALCHGLIYGPGSELMGAMKSKGQNSMKNALKHKINFENKKEISR